MPCSNPKDNKIRLCIREYGQRKKDRLKELDKSFDKVKRKILEKDRVMLEEDKETPRKNDSKRNKSKTKKIKKSKKSPSVSNKIKNKSKSKNNREIKTKTVKNKNRHITLKKHEVKKNSIEFHIPIVEEKAIDGKINKINKINEKIKIKKNTKKKKTGLKKKFKKGKSISLTVKKKHTGERRSRSFSPSINRNMISLQSYVPDTQIYDCKKKREIRVMKSNGEMKCFHWKHPRAQYVMLKNLFSKASKQYSYKEINTPLQMNANCWMNAMFMIFFISDKGRKFFRHLRKTMITGKIVTKDNRDILIPKKLHWPLFLFNKYIDAALQKKENTNYSELLDTNDIIKGLYRVIKYKNIGQAGNPLDFYISLLNYLSHSEIKIQNISLGDGLFPQLNTNLIKFADIKSENKSRRKRKIDTTAEFNLMEFHRMNEGIYAPHIIILDFGPMKKDNVIQFHLPQTIRSIDEKGKKILWKLDSSSIIDENGEHFASLITFNGRQLIHDGAMKARHVPLKWQNYLSAKNIKKSWKVLYPEMNNEGEYYAENFSTFCFGNTKYFDLYYYRV